MSTKSPRKIRIKRPTSPASHVYHYDIGSGLLHKPKCEIKNAQLFTKDKRIFLEPGYAYSRGRKPCELCRKRLLKD